MLKNVSLAYTLRWSGETLVRHQPLIDVCICTFRREHVLETLASLLLQDPGHPRFRILVADNDDHPLMRARIIRTSGSGIEIVYLHAPSRNISIARNACLAKAKADYIAFLDDDQIASPGWLTELHLTALKAGADIVLGPVHAICTPESPAWARTGKFHSTFPVIRENGIATGYTGNVLIKRSVIGANRFDLELGRNGGEDTLFFYRLQKEGAVIVYAPDAHMRELIPTSRANLKWLMRRAYRSGQTHGRLLAIEKQNATKILLISTAKLAACFALSGAKCLSATGWRHAFLRGMLHAGVISTLIGGEEIETYGNMAT